jgi:hypothetical protein
MNDAAANGRPLAPGQRSSRRPIAAKFGPRGATPVQMVPKARADEALQAQLILGNTPTMYRHGGRLLAEFSASTLWLLFWIFNGGCTAVTFAALAQWLGGKFTGGAAPVWTSYWLMVPVGVVVHLMISAMEQHLWQSGSTTAGTVGERLARMSKVRIAEAVTVGSLDSITTSRTIRIIALVLGAPAGLALNVFCAVLGTAMALVPEPMLRYHGVGLKTLMRR